LEPPRIYESSAFKAILELVKKVGPAEIPVLIAGETGSGKEVVAELIHANSDRRAKEMVCINCAGLPADLIESELFGSSKGAFTGSHADRAGLVKSAEGSTLFLDELSEMPLGLQSKLLRFIQDQRVRRIGSSYMERVNTRIIVAVNKAPRVCVAEKRLREDLYYRLSAVTITVPPLRQRYEDILPMAKAYLQFFSTQLKRQPPVISAEVEQALLTCEWPGNVRQLLNEMSRCALLCNGKVNLKDLDIQMESQSSDSLQQWTTVDINTLSELEQSEVRTIIKVLIESNFCRETAWHRLGLSRGTLYAKIKKFGIKTTAKRVRSAAQTPPHNGHVAPSAVHPPSPTPAPPSPHSAEPPVELPASRFAVWPGGGFLD